MLRIPLITLGMALLAMLMAPLSVSAAGPCLTQTLARGSRGSEVSMLQQYLVAEQLLAEDSATGYFGAMTEAAVQKWQAAHGPVNSGSPATTGFGMVGAKTRALLCSAASASGSTASAHAAPTTVAPAAVSAVSSAPAAPTSMTTTGGISYSAGVGKRPDLWSFRVSGNTIQVPGELVTLNWTVFDAASCTITTTEGETLASALTPIGTYEVRPDTPVTYVLSCTGEGDGSTSTPAMASTTQSVRIVNPAPTCTLAVGKPVYNFGETIKLSWTSTGAEYGTWEQVIGVYYPMPYGKIPPEGQYFFGVNGTVSQSVKLIVTGRGGTGECSTTMVANGPTASRGFFAQLASLAAALLTTPPSLR